MCVQVTKNYKNRNKNKETERKACIACAQLINTTLEPKKKIIIISEIEITTYIHIHKYIYAYVCICRYLQFKQLTNSLLNKIKQVETYVHNSLYVYK